MLRLAFFYAVSLGWLRRFLRPAPPRPRLPTVRLPAVRPSAMRLAAARVRFVPPGTGQPSRIRDTLRTALASAHTRPRRVIATELEQTCRTLAKLQAQQQQGTYVTDQTEQLDIRVLEVEHRVRELRSELDRCCPVL